MIFAPSTASIVEFAHVPFAERCFAYMATALGLDYWIVPQVRAHYHLNYTLTDDGVAATVRLVTHLAERKVMRDASDL